MLVGCKSLYPSLESRHSATPCILKHIKCTSWLLNSADKWLHLAQGWLAVSRTFGGGQALLHTQLCWWKSQGPKSVWPPWYPPFGPLRAGREHCTSFPPAQFRQNQPGLLRPVELLSVICIILPDTHTGNCTLNTPPATCGEQSPVGRVGESREAGNLQHQS